jgi:hypothetical protein
MARTSKVNPAVKKFMKGKKTAGPRTSVYTKAPVKKKVRKKMSTAERMDRGLPTGMKKRGSK